jgi:hypothetical protein
MAAQPAPAHESCLSKHRGVIAVRALDLMVIEK